MKIRHHKWLHAPHNADLFRPGTVIGLLHKVEHLAGLSYVRLKMLKGGGGKKPFEKLAHQPEAESCCRVHVGNVEGGRFARPRPAKRLFPVVAGKGKNLREFLQIALDGTPMDFVTKGVKLCFQGFCVDSARCAGIICSKSQ